jgi:hypothetical protein
MVIHKRVGTPIKETNMGTTKSAKVVRSAVPLTRQKAQEIVLEDALSIARQADRDRDDGSTLRSHYLEREFGGTKMVSNESAWFHRLVERLAYQLWEERGRPLGSPDQDWFRAEQVLQHHLGASSPDSLAFPPLPAFSLEPNE